MSQLRNRINNISNKFNDIYGEYYKNQFDMVILKIENDNEALRIIIDLFELTLRII